MRVVVKNGIFGLLVVVLGFATDAWPGAFELPEGRDVRTWARLEGNRYEFKNAMRVQASLERTRRILTQFDLFAGLVPYIDESRYDLKARQLDVAGGIWKYRLRATLQFREESSERWAFQIIRGHFKGLSGQLLFRRETPGVTLVQFTGSITAASGDKFPPRLIIEQGAQIIFAVTGRRVRSLIEDLQFEPQDAVTRAESGPTTGSRNESERADNDPSGSQIPSPRRRLGGQSR